MSRLATDWAWKTNPGSSSLKLILLSMADRADEETLCYPSIDRLVADTCLNKKTVQAGILKLIELGFIRDTGERKGATGRVRVFALNVTENGNVPKIGNIPKNGVLNDPKNGIQNLSVNQLYNQEREKPAATAFSPSSKQKPDNQELTINSPLGGLGFMGKFPMHETWVPGDEFLRQSAIQGIILTTPPTEQELAEFRIYWQAEGKAFHQAQWEQKLARRIQQTRQGRSQVAEQVPHWNSPESWKEFL